VWHHRAVPDVPLRLTVVVMAYDEVCSLEGVVDEIRAEADATGVDYEILIIDAGSGDGTGALADALADRWPRVRAHHHEPNQGLGGVYRTGFAEARGELLTYFPADAQFPAGIIGTFLPLMDAHDMVLGYLPQRDDALTAKLLSGAERVLYRVLFGGFPRFQGIMMLRTALLRELSLVSDGRGWAVVMELILRADRGGYRLRSEPTGWRPRAHGYSKVNNVRTIAANLAQLAALSRKL